MHLFRNMAFLLLVMQAIENSVAFYVVMQELNDMIVKGQELKLNLVKKNKVLYIMQNVVEYEHIEFIL